MSADSLDLSAYGGLDLSPDVYTGLWDTTTDFSGGSSDSNPTPGSSYLGIGPTPVPTFDSNGDVNWGASSGSSDNALETDSTSTYDLWGSLLDGTTLSGTSDSTLGTSGSASSFSSEMTSMISSLSKLGSSFATMFSRPSTTVSTAAHPVSTVNTGVQSSSLVPMNGTSTTMILIVAAALIFLLMRHGE
jgi:hypothetical protein